MSDKPRLLLATDLSARCDRPLDRALELTRELGATLVAAHVVEPECAAADAKDEEALRGTVFAEFPELATIEKFVVAHGSTPAVIAQLADELHCALILTGVARFNNLGDFVLGTAVDHLIRNTHVPVLVVKRRASRAYDRLVVATDLSSCSRHALTLAAALFPDARITLLHAYHMAYEPWFPSQREHSELRGEEKAALDDFVAGIPDAALRDRIDARLTYGALDAVIDQQTREAAGTLLVLGTRRRSDLAHATIGSRAEELLTRAPCDVLVVREAGPKGHA